MFVRVLRRPAKQIRLGIVELQLAALASLLVGSRAVLVVGFSFSRLGSARSLSVLDLSCVLSFFLDEKKRKAVCCSLVGPVRPVHVGGGGEGRSGCYR